MPRVESGLLKFARALLGGAEATLAGRDYRIAGGPCAPAEPVFALIQSGAFAGDATSCRANDVTRSWLRRQLLEPCDLATQHREIVRREESLINLAESPLSRLAGPGKGAAPPFLETRHVEAGERVRRLVERAALQPKLTMTYSASLTAAGGQNHAADISDLAADSRQALAVIYAVLPRECAGVVLDVCGLLKGLQQVEIERGWPRPSAKLVLRIGLDRLAEHYGLGERALGAENVKRRAWMGEGAQPQRFE